MSSEFGTGKTIFVLAIVVGCFAVLWPKIFYPMLTASVTQPSSGRQASWRNEANVQFLHQLCYLLEEHHLASTGASSASTSATGRWTGDECWQEVYSSCGVQLTEALVSEVRLGKDKSNLTNCLANRYSLTPAIVAAAAPPRVRPRPYLPQGMGPHARPERPPHLYPEMMHPALREKGRAMPQRTIDKQARPGPMPGVRPPMGGAGGIVPPPQQKGSGAMGIIMPLYTVGIVVFFVYTIMKVLFKKGQEDDKTPKLKDFGLDPEYRKYVFAEEYLDNTDISSKEQARRQAREESRNRKKAQTEIPPDTKIEDEQLDQLRRRLEETEKAMERLMCQMGSVTDKLTAAKITEVLSQAQAQAKILKEEVGEMTSEEDLTSSEALTTTLSEDTSLPTSLQRHLEEIQVEQLSSYSELLAEVGHLPVDASLPLGISVDGILSQQGLISSLDIQGAPAEAPDLGELIEGGRTVIQLQELKDDAVAPSAEESEEEEDIPEEEPEEQAETLPTGEESKDDSTPKEDEKVEAPAPEEKVTQEPETPEEVKESLPEVTKSTPADTAFEEENKEEGKEEEVNKGIAEAEEVDEDIAEAEEVVSPVAPASKETTPKPTSKPPEPIARELSSEGSSEATETGADISDLRSFAEENQASGQAVSKEPLEDSAAVQIAVENDEESESVCKGQGTQTSFALPVASPIDSKEDSTQTEKGQEVTVLGVNTSFRHDEGGIETRGGSQGPVASQQVTEIVLDALLPSETQLLVKDSQVVGSSAHDIEIDASEAEAVPCVVTSNVSLAFLGLEQRDDITPSPSNNSTLVAEVVSDVSPIESKDAPSQEIQDVEDMVPKVVEYSQEIIDSEALVPQLEVVPTSLPSEATVPLPEAVPTSLPLEAIVPQLEAVPTSLLSQALVPQLEAVPASLPLEISPVPECDVKNFVTEIQPSTTQPVKIPARETAVPQVEVPVTEPEEVKSKTLLETEVKKHSKAEVENADKEPQSVIKCTRVPEQSVDSEITPEAAQLRSVEIDADIKKPEKELTSNVALMPERTIGEPHGEVLPRPSSPLPPHVLENDESAKTVQEEEKVEEAEVEEEETEEGEKQQDNMHQIPVTQSLEAIAEAVASATTRAALDILAKTRPESFMPEEVAQIGTSKSTFLTEEIPTDQSPTSTDESSSATTVVAAGEAEDIAAEEVQTQSPSSKLVNGASSDSSTVYVATITHSPSGSPSSTPEMELSGETVEAALAEAAREEIVNSSMTKSTLHEQPVTQGGPGATTVSPKNEDSPTSSKGSSPDMDEYEVITKDEDQTTTATKEKSPAGGTATTKTDPVKPEASVQKCERKMEGEKHAVVSEIENEEEEEEEEEEVEEGMEVEEIPKKGNESVRSAAASGGGGGATATTKATAKTIEVATEEVSDEEEEEEEE